MVDDGFASHHAVDAAIFKRDGAIHHQHILALVAFDGIVFVLFGLMAEGRREHLVVLQRNGVEDQVLDGGVGGAQQRLGATGTLLRPYPDRGGRSGAGERSGHLASHGMQQSRVAAIPAHNFIKSRRLIP